MGLFSFFNKRTGYTIDQPSFGTPLGENKPEISKDLFIEEDVSDKKTQEAESALNGDKNINLLFKFLDRNLESNGYEDALRNPDISHLDQNILLIKNELGRTIKKVKTFYQDFVSEIDFHIESRSRSGMIDTVDELKMKKEIATRHIEKVIEIEEGSYKNQGDSQGIMMSYTRGFKNGLAAISHHSILKRTL
jgi:hypothetical protein